MITNPILLLFTLIGSHFYFDFAGQGPFMSDAKNRTKAIPGIDWKIVMFGHATIHGTVVAVLTGHWILGLLELVCHFGIDGAKCDNLIGFTTDQILHLTLKVIWWILALSGVASLGVVHL